MKVFFNLVMGAVGVLVFLLLIGPWPFYNGKEAAKRTVCLSNVKQQALGLILYQEDADGRYPARDAWMDATKRYARDREPFHHPGPNWESRYGYAFNARLSRAKTPNSPETTILTYDSVNPIRNASDPVASLPSPGRHDGKNSVGYADGHVRWVKP